MSYRLWCLVDGDSNVFHVFPPSTIGELKGMIQKKTNIDLAAHRFNLWKVNVDLAGIEEDIYAGKYRLNTAHEQPLRDIKHISEVWPQPPSEDQLHVYVTLPANMGSPTPVGTTAPHGSRGYLANVSKLPWLAEVHSKIWNRKELEPDLFRKVKVTEAHYTELQRRLKEQHPDRDFPEYDGRRHNVQSVKLDVLRLIFPANPPRHPDNNEDRVDDDDAPEASDRSEMDVDEPEASNDGGSTTDTIFPFTLRFLDLSTLGLRARVSHRLPLPLLLRQEYDHISRLIEDEPVNGHGSVIVSGQPGTGKTAYLHLRIIQSMIKGHSFLYQGLDRTVYHINEDGVQAIQSWSSDEIVAFVDGDRESYEPSVMLLDDRVQIIMASTLKGARGKWTEQAGDVKVIVTELWSPHELFLAGTFLYPLDISPELLKKSTSYFGYNPRRCFNSAFSAQKLEETKEAIKSRITDITSEQSNMVHVLISSRRGDSGVSHSIFEISPKDKLRLHAQCKFSYVSRWAFDCFLEAYETRQAAAAADFYRYISGTPAAVSLWGHVFERLVFNHLVGIDAEHEFPMRGLSIPGQTMWTFRGRIPRFNFRQDSDFIGAITNAIQNENPLHLVPSIRNFPAVDSIVYDPNEVLTCIRITVSSQHPIRVSGLQQIQSWLERGTLLADLRPSKDRPWRVIFIVPSRDEASFELQPLEGDTALGEWAGKVHQYVLGLDVFRKPE